MGVTSTLNNVLTATDKGAQFIVYNDTVTGQGVRMLYADGTTLTDSGQLTMTVLAYNRYDHMKFVSTKAGKMQIWRAINNGEFTLLAEMDRVLGNYSGSANSYLTLGEIRGAT